MQPYAWIVGLVAEGFHCRPTEAEWELENDPRLLCLEILELRAFRDAWVRFKDAKKPGDLDASPLMTEVQMIAYELAREGRRS